VTDYIVEVLDDPEAEAAIAPDGYSVEILVKEATKAVSTVGGAFVEVFAEGDVSLIPLTLDGGTSVAGIVFMADGEYEGLTVIFGPAPLPDPALYPNTVYFILPEAE
jgi:hypothetical protein